MAEFFMVVKTLLSIGFCVNVLRITYMKESIELAGLSLICGVVFAIWVEVSILGKKLDD